MQKWRGILGWLTLGLSLAFFLVGGQTAGAQEQKATAGLKSAAEIVALLGDVEIKSPQEAAFRKAQLKDPLNPGDQVRTLKDSRAKLWFRDETVLILNENTTMEISQFQADASGRPEKSRFKVLQGAMRFILAKVYAAVPRTFEIEGQTAIMGLRGTDGVYETRSPDTIYLISGAPIRLFDKATGQSITLNPMQFAVSVPGRFSIQPITPQMLRQLIEQYRVAQLYIPREVTTPPVPPALLAYLFDFGNPLMPQTSSFRDLEITSYIYQPTLPTLHNQAPLPTIHNR